MEDKIKAKEILEYCVSYLTNKDNLEVELFKDTKLFKEMVKEIEFMLNTN